jgi:hypothetical protein
MSGFGIFFEAIFATAALVVELVDTQDLKSCSPQREYGFDSRLGHEMMPIGNLPETIM